MTDRGLVRYVGRVYDSIRWEGFALRPDDIVISTPPKCGTTWTQMICALLVFRTPDLPDRLSNLSPWLDMVNKPRREVFTRLEGQEHRRFIKTHTPLPGLPRREGVTYICVARDPRDVALSMDDHLANMDWQGFHAQRVAAAREDGLPEPEPVVAPPLDLVPPGDRFWRWCDDDTPPETASSSLLRTVRHIETFWIEKDSPGVVMIHYDDLKSDLEREMRLLAARLGIEVDEERWPSLVEAATFGSMRRAGDKFTPTTGIWKDPNEFFRQGRRGAWRDLPGYDQMRYEQRISALVDSDLAEWLHRPLRAAAD